MCVFFENIIQFIVLLFSYIYGYKHHSVFIRVRNKLYGMWIRRMFLSMGKSTICTSLRLSGGKHISIGNNTMIGYNTILAAHDFLLGKHFSPQIVIGDNVNIGDDSNISCINKIIIGNGVRMGRRVMLNDNSHGTFERHMLDIQPNLRPLVSKGPIVIEENVWIGEMVCVLGGVHIGKGSIIGAGSVVTKDIPPYSLACGIPAKVVKRDVD